MIVKAKQGDNQDRNVYNAYKRLLRDIKKLTNEQLAELNFEVYHEARMRGAVNPE
jgi:hypothetical protein